MILLCGLSGDAQIVRAQEKLREIRRCYILLDQHNFNHAGINYIVDRGRVIGKLAWEEVQYSLEEFTGIYARIDLEPTSGDQRSFCEAITEWMEISSALVVNRPSSMASNFSKSYQIQVIRNFGFLVPETLITNDPELARAFRCDYGRVIYKSISSSRSIVRTLEEADLPRLEHIVWCPIQLQALVAGMNIRVHVIGGGVFASAIQTEAIDYRYAARMGDSVGIYPFNLPSAVESRCRKLARALNLHFAGIDLILDDLGNYYCLEVNPSPAFDYYEQRTRQPIAYALAEYLAGGG